MYRMHSRGALTLMVIAAIAILVIAGCSSTSKKEQTPAGSTMTLTASPTTFDAGTTTVVEATIKNGGAGVPDQVVTFTASPSTVGYFTPAVDTTDAAGVAATVFTATTSGAATITASVNGSNLTKDVGVSVNAVDNQTGSGNLNITVTPTLLLANGSDTAQVRVTVRDALGQFAPDSTVVKLTAGEKFVDKDGNGYWSPGIDSLVYDANANGQWDALGLIPSIAYVTGGAGQVSVNYVSGNDAMTVYVKATVDENGLKGFGEVPLQLSPNASVASIQLFSDSINLVVKQTGGIESALLQAICYDQNTNTVPEGLTVNFIITDGPGGGEHLANVGYGPYQAVTNSQGIATVSIHSGTVAGTIRVRAWVDTVLSNATQVMVSAGPPAFISVGVDTCNVPYWNTVGYENGVTAIVSDIYHNPVVNNTAVYFTCDEGVMKSHEERTTDLNGLVHTIWYSGYSGPGADGVVHVYCETSGGTVTGECIFFNSGGCATLNVLSAPTTLPADGKSKADVLISGLDGNGNYMVDGTLVKAHAGIVSVTEGNLANGCYASSAVLTITSGRLDQDYSLTGGNDDGIGATDVVTIRVGLVSQTVPITLTTGFASRTNSSINGSASVDTSQTIDFSVTIKDRWNNPLGDHTLVMSATGGTVIGSTQETDGYGEAYGFKWKAPAVAGSQTISISDTDPRGGIVLTFAVTVNAGS